MRKRKLQIFLSSTYEDLIDHRLAAMEAILAAGHIPAAMEQFSAGDETAWEKIKAWIDESNAFILILGGRYGSVEPSSGRSYVQLEYEYAIEKKKPFFALVVSDKHHNERLKQFGKEVDERENPEKYKKFRAMVIGRLCKFWDDMKDIESEIFHKLPEWGQRDDLVGWVRGDEATNPETANELARLSRENRELRDKAPASAQTFLGLTFEELVDLLTDRELSSAEKQAILREIDSEEEPKISSLLEAFGELFKARREITDSSRLTGIINELSLYGLVERHVIEHEPGLFGATEYWVRLTHDGLRFRNAMLVLTRSASKNAKKPGPTRVRRTKSSKKSK